MAVKGSKANSLTNGKICSKVAKGFRELVHGERRLSTPLARVGSRGEAKFREISWETAYNTIKQRFTAIIEQYSSEAIVPFKYAGPMGLLNGSSMDERFFRRLGASRLNSVPLCAGTSAAAWQSVFGNVGGIAHEEMAHAKLIVIWANNITVGHLHITKLIRQARKDGAKVVVVDPRKIRIAADADLHLSIRPGTDVILAYAVANRIRELGGLDHAFIDEHVSGTDEYLNAAKKWSLQGAAEICGLHASDIDRFARLWCTTKPAALSIGVALERTRNGGSAIRAAYALPLLTGNFGDPGAGICKPSGYFSHLDRAAIKRLAAPVKETRTLDILDLAGHILEEDLPIPIKALFIYNHNPLAVHPQQTRLLDAMSKDELFIVACDHTLTDSVAYADIVLPAATSMENTDLYKAYGHAHLQLAKPVIQPVGLSKPNTQIFRELAEVFAFEDPEFKQSDQELLELITNDIPDLNRSCDLSKHTKAKVVFRTTSPDTPTTKAMLFDPVEQQRAELGIPAFKTLSNQRRFTLISPSSDKRTNSTFGGTKANSCRPEVEVNYQDAMELGLSDGDRVKLVNEFAELELILKLSEDIRPGIASVDKGAWLQDNPAGLSVNALIPGHKSDMADGACYNDCQVDILRA